MAEKKLRIVTHNGGYHADDLFAVATVLLHLKKEKDEVEIIRTRDPELIESGDYVVDVGMVYDPEKNCFDHHQREGAGERENGIPYAAFGLVWKEFGESIAGSKRDAEKIDKKLVQSVDAQDVGYVAWKQVIPDFFPYTIQSVLFSFAPPPEADLSEIDDVFVDLLDLVTQILVNEIEKSKWESRAEDKITRIFEETTDKRLVVLDDSKGWDRVFISLFLAGFPEPVYFVRQHRSGDWQVVAVEDDLLTPREKLPESWLGKKEEDLIKETGVSDAVFCHSSGFMCIAKTKEGAVAMAKLALES